MGTANSGGLRVDPADGSNAASNFGLDIVDDVATADALKGEEGPRKITREAPEPPAPEPPSWTEGLSDDDRKYVEGKKFSDPAAVIKAQREAEAQMHRAQQERSEYEKLLNELAQAQQAQQQAPPAPAAGGNGELPDEFVSRMQQLAQMADEGRIDFGQAIGTAALESRQYAISEMENRLNDRLEKFEKERVRPLEDSEWTEFHRRKASSLSSSMGEGFNEIAGRAEEILSSMFESNPNAKYDENAVDTAVARAYMEKDMAERAARNAQTLEGTGGAGGTRPPDAAESIISGMKKHAPANVSGGIFS